MGEKRNAPSTERQETERQRERDGAQYEDEGSIRGGSCGTCRECRVCSRADHHWALRIEEPELCEWRLFEGGDSLRRRKVHNDDNERGRERHDYGIERNERWWWGWGLPSVLPFLRCRGCRRR